MFTRFNDFFKPDSKVDKNNPRRYYSNSGWREYTQEELDKNLFESIHDNDYDRFVEMIERGANTNIITPDENDYMKSTKSPLTEIILGWKHNNKDQFKFLKYLNITNLLLTDSIFTKCGNLFPKLEIL